MSDLLRSQQSRLNNSAWRRWKMASVESDKKETTSAPVDSPAELSEKMHEHLALLEQESKERGHARGYGQGRELGYQEGRQEGHAIGLKEGQEQGFEAGKQQAQEQGKRQNEIEAQKLAALFESSTAALQNIEAEAGQALIHLAVSIAQQVIRSTLALEPEKLLATVRDILQLDTEQEGILRLRVHPDDVALLESHLADDPAARHWRLQADTSIERGGCIADTPMGSIDATLQTRWQRVVSALGDRTPWSNSP